MTVLGIVQIVIWGSTLYLPGALAPAIAAEMGWSVPAIRAACRRHWFQQHWRRLSSADSWRGAGVVT